LTIQAGSIVYLVHGPEKFHEQARFSILTLLAAASTPHEHQARIVAYTDRPELLPDHPSLSAIRISAGDMKLWRGPLDFVHRAKLEVMRRAAAKFGAPLVYVDSDTRWLAYPEVELGELHARTAGDSGKPILYLHENEGVLSPKLHPRYFEALSGNAAVRRILARRGVALSSPWTSWNAGVIGVPRGAESFFDDALALTDDLTLRLRPRTYVEQLAVSLVAARDYSVKTLDNRVHHYWNVSAEFTSVLHAFLAGIRKLPIEAQIRAAGGYVWDEQALRGTQHAPAQRWKTRYKKWMNSLHKRRMDLKAIWLRSLAGL
jgi:hypothetical protein